MGVGAAMVLAGSCGDGGGEFEGFLVRICVPKFFKKYSN